MCFIGHTKIKYKCNRNRSGGKKRAVLTDLYSTYCNNKIFPKIQLNVESVCVPTVLLSAQYFKVIFLPLLLLLSFEKKCSQLFSLSLHHLFKLFVWNPISKLFSLFPVQHSLYSATSTFWIANPNNNLINCAAAGSEVSFLLSAFHFLLAHPPLPPPLISFQVEACLINALPGKINGCVLLLPSESSRQQTEALPHFHEDTVPIMVILLGFQKMFRVEWSVIYPCRCNNYSHLHTLQRKNMLYVYVCVWSIRKQVFGSSSTMCPLALQRGYTPQDTLNTPPWASSPTTEPIPTTGWV